MYIHLRHCNDTTSPLSAVAEKPKNPRKKKDAQLVLRLNSELRDRFIDACQDLDTTAAREVRRFIKRFLKRSSEFFAIEDCTVGIDASPEPIMEAEELVFVHAAEMFGVAELEER